MHRPYTQSDLLAPSSSTAGVDLGAFFRSHVEGAAALAMDSVLALAGLKLIRNPQNEENIAEDLLAAVATAAPRRATSEHRS